MSRELLNILTKITNQRLILPMYHCVSDKPIIHLQNLYKIPNKKQFENDLDFILKNFKPASLEDILNHANGNKIIEENSFHLTFDDGFTEVFENAIPILERKCIPATLFINTAFVENTGLMFRCKVSLIINELKSTDAKLKLSQKLKCKTEEIQSILLSLNHSDTALINECASLVGIDFNRYLNQNKPYLSLEQLKIIEKKGYTIGAHSFDHPEFKYLSDESQIVQVKKSVDYIKSNFNQKFTSFSFPFTDFGISKKVFETIYNLTDSKF